MNNTLPYDEYSPKSIESYAKQIEGLTFREILTDAHEEYKGKGGLGQIIEKYHFMYELNSDKEPDFNNAGVELKVTPYKRIKKTKKNPIPYSAKERLVMNVINFEEIVNESFSTSSFLHKNSLLLLLFYLHDYDKADRLDFIIKYAQLFQYPKEDFQIIEQDWNKIVNKIREGKAHELSEGDTMYLGACTKGSRKEDNYRQQPYSDTKAQQRAFSLKNSYMTHILRNYILEKKQTYEPIIKDSSILEHQTLETYVENKISKYYGRDIESLCSEFNVSIHAKDKTSKVALKILGVNSNSAEEFKKANIEIKTIRIESNGIIKQHMSFPAFEFKSLINETWENSNFRCKLNETKFFFIIYRFDNTQKLILEKTMFWNMPVNIIETEVRQVWLKTIETIKNGVILTKRKTKVFNNLPSASDNNVCHVRPHASKASYEPFNKNADELPDGRWMTKQCFWLNNNFILNQINKTGLTN
ncbi:Sau3AI family type II restriction endonuclease [Vallitalea guaymasensis]|uniref:Sau3AI family type II restriction endonuclease n=1 Tax=Vallitalea guaymasensis TaxID=1185412 RepID=UPI000DE37DE0|nr:Sau3AI family type II restriction endonuclease [Vallitalea guaymasensis]